MRVGEKYEKRKALMEYDEKYEAGVRERNREELGLTGDRTGYIVRRGRTEYLQSIIKSPISGRLNAVYAIYKYDACFFKDRLKAKQAALSLMEPYEEWSVFHFDRLNGDEELIWTRTA